MREKIKCLDGPLEDEEALVSSRLMVLYNKIILTDKDHNNYEYMIVQTGLKFVKES